LKFGKTQQFNQKEIFWWWGARFAADAIENFVSMACTIGIRIISSGSINERPSEVQVRREARTDREQHRFPHQLIFGNRVAKVKLVR
jgi:hypothetical protein